MHLAQELVDHIIDFLHDDPRSLLRVSLVSRVWVGRTRTYLYDSLKITRSKLFFLNFSCLTSICGYVKILHFAWPKDATDPSTIFDRFEQSKLHTLAIHFCELRDLDRQIIQRSFAKFPCTSITALELHDTSPTQGTFLTLLSLFPNVDDLMISVNNRWKDESIPDPLENVGDDIIQPISPPRLRGSFKFSDPSGRGFRGSDHSTQLLRTVAGLPPKFQTISLDINGLSQEVLPFLYSCSKTVRKIFVRLSFRKFRHCIPSTPVCSA